MAAAAASEALLLLLALLLVLCCCCPCSSQREHQGEEMGTHAPARAARSRNAYASMMYMGTPRDYDFYIAIRVMMQSLLRLQSDADLVVIASKSVPPKWLRTMSDEGVRVVPVDDIPNPYEAMPGFNGRFIFTLNKIYAWTLTEYDRVVMLDADNMFLQNTDELFQCGQFCAAFINPCYFHTGLFVLQPSNATFQEMLGYIRDRKDNNDGADQGLLTSYFADLLERPLFVPPRNGTVLDGYYRLPLGYQMDASYFYLRLKWNVPCGPNSVVTFPSIPLLKPWYWWSWPVLPLGLAWHEQRRKSIGYSSESQMLSVQALFYLLTMAVSLILRRKFATPERPPFKTCMGRCPCPDLTQTLYRLTYKLIPIVTIAFAFLATFMVIPTTVHPFMAWSAFLFGSFSYLVVAINVFQLPALATMTPWLGIVGVLLVMAAPVFDNGIQRCLAIGTYAFCAAPFLWWSARQITGSRDIGFAREPLMAYGRQQEQPQSELMKLC